MVARAAPFGYFFDAFPVRRHPGAHPQGSFEPGLLSQLGIEWPAGDVVTQQVRGSLRNWDAAG